MKQLIKIARGYIYLIVLAIISVCTILLPELAREEAAGRTNPPSSFPYFYIGSLSIPIFVALRQTLIFIKLIEENKAFSELSIKVLQNIKYCLIAFSGMIVFGAISTIVLAKIADPSEDVTPVITFGFIFTFVSSVMGTFIAVLQKLLQEATEIKSENDFMV